MAEAVLSIVAQGIKPLGNLIVQEAKFLSGVDKQVEDAQRELHSMGAFMKDADSRSGDNEVVRDSVKQIRDLAYDLEDVIESFALKVVLRRRGGTVKLALKSFTCFISEGVDRHRIGSEIQDIMNKLSSLRSSLQNYNIRQSDPERVAASKIQKQRDWRLTYGHEIESHIVGLEGSTNILMKELVREGKHHRVVSIWGMGGSGKTTLAKQVFLQDEVKRHFAYIAWVCISQPCDGRAALEEILIKLTSPTDELRKQIAKLEKYEIAEKLCRIQREKRCLVILDDMWTQEAWHSLKAGFPVNEETESRILLTTRKKEVALLASTNDFLHQPQALDEKQSWNLFEKIAISESDRTDLEKKRELGNKMLVHCSGLPLAITVLAGLLSRRDTIDEWDSVHRNVDVYIMRGNNVLDRETTNLEYGVSGVLALSYDDLPSQLKLCFLYLAQFPEDHEIHVKRLTQLWIAEGFITSTSDIHGSVELMEDVAYGCLIELVERSMVQIVKFGLTGKVKTCRLHDLMRDMCLQKAKEENFLDIVNFSSGHASRTAVIGNVRRRVVYLDKNMRYESSSRDGRDDHIRSLLYFAPEWFLDFRPKWSKRVMRSVVNDFRLLRVLKLENILRKLELPKTIGNLVHLRFLSLKKSVHGELPSSVSNLVLLQTLDLRSYPHFSEFRCFGCEKGIQIRNVFRNMEQLRHLYLPANQPNHTESGQKLSLARLHNLQTLVNISLKRCDLNDFVHLTNLKKLWIIESQSGRLEKLKSVLISTSVTFEHLGSLSVEANGRVDDIPRDIVLRCPQLYKLRLVGKMTELPEELLNYPNLTKITLLHTHMKDNQIGILEKLPKLRVLYLRHSFQLETVVFSKGGFPHLEFLTLEFLKNLKEWTVEKEAMPCLHRLCIRYCEKLLAIPDGIKNITTLKELTIDAMPSTFCDRVAEGGDDFYKIKHVPSLILTNVRESSTEMEEAAGASEVVVGLAGESHQESTVEAPPPADEKTEEIQASSTPNVPY